MGDRTMSLSCPGCRTIPIHTPRDGIHLPRDGVCSNCVPSIPMPQTRAGCYGPGACIKLSCRHNLMSTVRVSTTTCSLTVASGTAVPIYKSMDIEGAADDVVSWVESGRATCALDVADSADSRDHRGEMTLEGVGDILGVTRERVRQIQGKGLRVLGSDIDWVKPLRKHYDEIGETPRKDQRI